MSALRGWFGRPGLRRGRDPDPAGLARQRDPPARLRDRTRRPRRPPTAALSAHVAGIHLQEAARRRRDEAVHLRPRVPQPRAWRAAPSRIHDAGMVPRPRALPVLMADCAAILDVAAKAAGSRHGCRGTAAAPIRAPRQGSSPSATPLPRSPASTCWRRCAGRRARPSRPQRRSVRRHPGRRRRHVVRHLQPRPGRADRTAISASALRRCSTEYPLPEAALARPTDRSAPCRSASSSTPAASNWPTALASCTDAQSSAGGSKRQWPRRKRRYGERYPIDPDFLAALAVMPPTSGVALGFDRLVMLLTGASRIEQVLWAPVADGGRDQVVALTAACGAPYRVPRATARLASIRCR